MARSCGLRPGRTGGAPPHDATGHTWHHTDQVLFVGPAYDSAMPAFAGILSDDEIIAVLSYIKSRWPDRIRRRHDEMNARQEE